MKTSQMVVCLLCIGAMPVSHVLAQGKSGKHGIPGGFPSVPAGHKFIVPGAGVVATPVVMAPSPAGLSGLLTGGATAPSAAGGVAGGNMPSVSAAANGLPPQAKGLGIPGGKHREEAGARGGPNLRAARETLDVAAGESGEQSASRASNATPGEIHTDAALQANQVIDQSDPRALPTCR